MADSDDDYTDVGDQERIPTEDDTNNTNNSRKKTNGRRGKDISWSIYESYSNTAAFSLSDFKKELKKEFTLRKAWEIESADNEHYTCKYSRKKGYIPCPLQYKVSFSSSCDEVVVYSPDGVIEHQHIMDENYESQTNGIFRWSAAQTTMIFNAVKLESKPKVILRNLREANLIDEENPPTSQQLNNK